jgi:hypothetical protein
VIAGIGLAIVFAACDERDTVDPAVTGTWEIAVPGGRWILSIDSAGAYSFVNEAGGPAPSHSGEFRAADGRWSLRATTMTLEDAGSYALGADGLELSGNLGATRWSRAAQASVTAGTFAPSPADVPPSPNPPSPSSASTPSNMPTAQGAVPDIIDPCLLVTADDASAVLGATVANTDRRTPQARTQNDCRYRVPSDYTRQLSVTTYNGAGMDIPGYLERHRRQGGEPLASVGDGAFTTYRDATGLTSVAFVIGAATFEITMSGVPRDRSIPAVQSLASQAAKRLTSGQGTFVVPGLPGFVGTWTIHAQEQRSGPTPPLIAWVAADGAVRMQTVGTFGGAMLLKASTWNIEGNVMQAPISGEYRLRGGSFTFQTDAIRAELQRVPCGQAPKIVTPPYELSGGLSAFLTGRNLSMIPLSETPADPFNAELRGLWEGEGTANGQATQFLVAIDARGRSTFGLFPVFTGRLRANDGTYTMALQGLPEASGTYRFQGGINDGSISLQDGADTMIWTPYDPERNRAYAEPILGHCD